MYNGTITANAVTPSVNMKNRIINGAMVIDQRNAGASVANAGAGTAQYLLDRWQFFENGSMAFSAQQSTTAPTGFVNSLLLTVTTSASPSSATRCQLVQRIEGFNTADLMWGTANARTVTLSFWVRSSLTGTFGGSMQNNAQNRAYPFQYTISSANTWEQKSITVAGDTSGTWVTNNEIGLSITFDLGMGSDLLGTAGAWASSDFRGATGDVKLAETNGATWYVTGVQLEVGSTATSFDYRPYGTELALCQRYYYKTTTVATGVIAVGAFADSTTSFGGYGSFPIRLRATPTALSQSGTASDYNWNGTSSVACSAVPTFSSRTTADMWQVNFTVSSGLTAGHGGSVVTVSGNGFLAWSAEL
jgi:hypothetical protein